LASVDKAVFVFCIRGVLDTVREFCCQFLYA
jgi:hypothetical protein